MSNLATHLEPASYDIPMRSVRARISAMIRDNPHGWLSEEKGFAMAELIARVRPALCVEIGVYSGRSFLAQAFALKAFGGGLLVGIDPWQNQACTEADLDPENAKWWASLDLHGFHRDFMERLWRYGLEERCLVVRNTADAAAALFRPSSIDILHIDGNHSEAVSCRDVERWLPLVEHGGHIWFDDVNWSSTQRAVKRLESACEFVLQADQARLYKVKGGAR